MSNSAFALIDYIEVAIGDQVIDRHTGEWLHIYNELFNSVQFQTLWFKTLTAVCFGDIPASSPFV